VATDNGTPPTPTLAVDAITVGARHRKDLGDLDALARSIADLGLLQPVAVDASGRLVAGERRLQAVRKLGWQTVPVYVVTGVDDALRLLQAERDENTERLAFRPSEAVALGAALEELARREAKERQKQGGRAGGKASGKLPEASAGDTRDTVGAAVGMSGRNYEKAKAVVTAAIADPARYGNLQAWMDRTGKVHGAYQTLRRMELEARRDEQAAALTADYGIVTGDFRQAGRVVPDGSVDVLFTDPPYTLETIGLYEDLARFGARVLRPGGLLLCYCGTYFVPQALALLGRHLDYAHCCAVGHRVAAAINHRVHLRNMWKPIFLFVKPPLEPWWKLTPDFASGGAEKDAHDWQQAVGEAEHFVGALCPPKGICCDPFVGSGTTAVACARLRRRFIGFEIDPQTAGRARARLAEEGGDRKESA
jgi:hypothetical protein